MKWNKPKTYRQLQNNNGLKIWLLGCREDGVLLMIVDKEFKTFVQGQHRIITHQEFKDKVYTTWMN